MQGLNLLILDTLYYMLNECSLKNYLPLVSPPQTVQIFERSTVKKIKSIQVQVTFVV